MQVIPSSVVAALVLFIGMPSIAKAGMFYSQTFQSVSETTHKMPPLPSLAMCHHYISSKETTTIITKRTLILHTIRLPDAYTYVPKIIHNMEIKQVSSDLKLQHSKYLFKSGSIFIVCENTLELSSIIKEGQKYSYWNYQATFFVISTCSVDYFLPHKLFNITNSIGLTNIILILRGNCGELFAETNMDASGFCFYSVIQDPITRELTTASRGKNLCTLIQSKSGNMHGKILKVSAEKTYQPIINIVENADGSFQYLGILGPMFESLMQYMNFTSVHISTAVVPTAGMRLNNGTWTYILGDLDENRADIALSAVTLTPERYLGGFQFPSPPLIATSFVIVVRESENLPKWMSFIQPYLPETWLLILISLVTMEGYMLLAHSVNGIPFTPMKTFIYLFRILLQGSEQQPKKFSLRCPYILWVQYTLLISSIYQGSILSFITFPRQYPPMKTFEDLVDVEVTIVGEEVYLELLKESDNPYLNNLYKHSHPVDDIRKELLSVIKRTDLGVINPELRVKYVINSLSSCETCNKEFYIVNETVGLAMLSFCVSKQFQYFEKVNTLSLRAMGGGLVKLWQEKAMMEAQVPCVVKATCASDSNQGLTIVDVEPSFITLVVGYIISFIYFTVEVWYFRSKQPKYNNHQVNGNEI